MKMRSLPTVLMSAYLSAMLASSLAPMAGNITLAGTVNPGAAQAAFREALIGSQAAGWTQAVDTPAAPKAEFMMVAHSAPQADPIMSETALANLLKLIAEADKPGSIPAGVCAHFKLCDGTAKLPMRMVQTTNPKGDYMAKPWDGAGESIVIARRMPDGSVQFFLTDKSQKLIAAASSINNVATIIDVAAAKPTYEATLAHLAVEGGDAPKTGTSVASAGS